MDDRVEMEGKQLARSGMFNVCVGQKMDWLESGFGYISFLYFVKTNCQEIMR